jgi:hypothetical protein
MVAKRTLRHISTADYIDWGTEVYGELYTYELTEYINRETPIIVTCKIHGQFRQQPYRFIRGYGCLQCSYGSRGLDTRTENFITKALLVHGNTYDYSNVNYINGARKISIVCKKHGIFNQRPEDHLTNHGCPKCGEQRRETTCIRLYGAKRPIQLEQFKLKRKNNNIQKYGGEYGQKHNLPAFELLNDKNWLYNEYVTCKKSSPQISIELNVSEGSTRKYLQKHNIEITRKGNFSGISIHWLNFISVNQDIFIQHAQNLGEYQLPGTKLIVDGFCENTNTCYEFHGDIWHGNPKLYQPHEKCNPFSKLTAGELYQRTMERDATIKNLGYNLEVMWESDYNIISKLIT